MKIETQAKEMALETLLKDIPRQIENLRSVRETFLTDAVLLGEIPSPTFGEQERIRLVMDRFRENGAGHCRQFDWLGRCCCTS